MKLHWLEAAVVLLAGAGCSLGQTIPPANNAPSSVTEARSQNPESPADVQQAGAHQPETGQLTCRVRAIVDGQVILDDEVRQAALPLLREANALPEPERTARMKVIFEGELEKLVERELIMKDAEDLMGKRPESWKKLKEFAAKEFEKTVRSYKERLGNLGIPCETEEQLKDFLARDQLTLDGLRRQIERNFMAMEFMRHKVFPLIERIGHKEIEEYYDQHPGEFQLEDRVRWQDIFIDSSREPHPNREAARRFAEEIARKARMGDDFARLCEMYDNGDSVFRKGDGYGAKHGEIRPFELEAYLFQMNPGDLGPVVELYTGFHVFRLVERQYAGPQPFDEKTQAQIKKKLSGIIMEREYKRLITEMRRTAVINTLPY